MRGAPLLVALALAGCGGGDGDAALEPQPSPTPTVVNATEREETAVAAACTELKAAMAGTRPLPRTRVELVRALRAEIEAVRTYRRALESIDPDAAPSWHVGGQAKHAKNIERTHRRHIAAIERTGRLATQLKGTVPLELIDPRVLSDSDEQSFGADCG